MFWNDQHNYEQFFLVINMTQLIKDLISEISIWVEFIPNMIPDRENKNLLIFLRNLIL